jgi:6-phosphogluconate dehydrogenase (decarboxylating)
MVGIPKSNIISSIIENADFPIERKDVVCIGVNSGGNGQSNKDRVAAEACGIDYIDLYQLLYNMY